MSAYGVTDDGFEVLLLETGNTRFEDEVQQKTWVIS
jgi:hypothetical protein